jgi:hypothetical protein
VQRSRGIEGDGVREVAREAGDRALRRHLRSRGRGDPRGGSHSLSGPGVGLLVPAPRAVQAQDDEDEHASTAHIDDHNDRSALADHDDLDHVAGRHHHDDHHLDDRQHDHDHDHDQPTQLDHDDIQELPGHHAARPRRELVLHVR